MYRQVITRTGQHKDLVVSKCADHYHRSMPTGVGAGPAGPFFSAGTIFEMTSSSMKNYCVAADTSSHSCACVCQMYIRKPDDSEAFPLL